MFGLKKITIGIIIVITFLVNLYCSNNSADTAVSGNLINVPEISEGAVITDGIFSPGEWDNAKPITVNDNLVLYVMQNKDVFYIGLKCPAFRLPVTDLFVSPDENNIYQFHISAQLGEKKLAPEGQEDPVFEYGNTNGWYGNEIRWNYGKARQLQEEGKSAGDAQVESAYPHEGHEFVFRKDKFNSDRLFIRIEMMYLGNYETPLVFPEGTASKDVTDWIELEL